MNTAKSISEKVQRGEVHCAECRAKAVEPVIGWFFDSFRAWCPEHRPMGVDLDFGQLPHTGSDQ